VATVGLTEGQAHQRGLDNQIGSYRKAETPKGMAMAEEDGFVKVVMEDESYRILGAHIIGPYAPILIQEVINVMHAGDGSAYPIFETMHIHPALPEVVQRAFYNLHKPGQHRH
jgi:dihydrolipoamide dehydrogenase